MTEKHFITAETLLEDSYQLGAQILKSQFRPDFIVGIWRGGAPVGIAVQEMLEYFGVTTDHISVRTSLYKGVSESRDEVRVHGLDYLVDNLNSENSLLIIDDVYDSGRSIDAVIERLKARTRRNSPHQIRVATPWYKPGNNQTERVPDYYVHITEAWLVFPHEVQDLSLSELKEGKGRLYDIIRSVEL